MTVSDILGSSTVMVAGVSNGNGNTNAGAYGEGPDSGVSGFSGFVGSGGVGVNGISASASGTDSASNLNAAVFGAGTASPGVQGQSAAGYGLIGFTNATGGQAADHEAVTRSDRRADDRDGQSGRTAAPIPRM